MLDQNPAADEITRHGAYVCLRLANASSARAAGAVAIGALADKLGFAGEFATRGAPSAASIAFLRRSEATAGEIADDDLQHADAVIHVAAPAAPPVSDFCDEAARRLGVVGRLQVLRGVGRPKAYTGAAMNAFAYAHAVVQQPGTVMPHGFLIPMSKTPAWWAKDWMERHTYFLPRYDDAGRMISEGHALAAAAGIPCLLRRTYKSETEPAAEGRYDFLTYFECADADVPVFHRVCANLRDVVRNPEWQFVREGPTWHGRRVATWPELFREPAP